MSLVNDRFNFNMETSTDPQYFYRRQPPQNGSTDVTITSSGATDTLFKIPADMVKYMGESSIEMDVVISGTTDKFVATNANPYVFFDSMQYYSEDNSVNMRMDIPNLNNYCVAVQPYTINKSQIDINDRFYDNDGNPLPETIAECGAIFEGLHKTDVTANPYMKVDTADDALKAIDTRNYYDYRNLIVNVSDSTFTKNIALKVVCKLKDIPHSIFSDNKVDYCAGKHSYLNIKWANTAKIAWLFAKSTNSINYASLSANAANITISNLYLQIATEINPDTIMRVKNLVNKGLNMTIPYVYLNKKAVTASTTNHLQFTFNLSKGQSLQRIYWFHMRTSETAGGNFPVTVNLHATKTSIIGFKTFLNGVQLQESKLNTLTLDDYKLLKKKGIFDDTIIQNSVYFYDHYCWVEDFTNGKTQVKDNNYDNMNKGIYSGLPMQTQEIEYRVELETGAYGAGNIYCYAVFLRDAKQDQSGFTFEPHNSIKLAD